MKEWFSSNELVGLAGLSSTARNITREAKTKKWKSRWRVAAKGKMPEFHYTSLPFETQIALGLTAPLSSEQFSAELFIHEAKNQSSVLVPEISSDNHDTFISIPLRYLSHISSTPIDLRIWTCDADNMAPEIKQGESLLIDTNIQNKLMPLSGLFLVEVQTGLTLIKLNYSISKAGYHLRHNHKACPDEFIDEAQFQYQVSMVGKVAGVLFRPLPLAYCSHCASQSY